MRAISPYLIVPLLVVIAVVQSTVMSHLTIAGVKPDLMLLVVISWSSLRGAEEGILWGFIAGLSLDLVSGAPFGVSTLAMLIVSFLSGLGEVNIFGTHIALPLTTVFFATIFYDLLFLLLLEVTGWSVVWFESFIKLILPSALLNVALMPVIYWAMRWLHRRTGREQIGW